MSETNPAERRPALGRPLTWAIRGAVLIAVVWMIYVGLGSGFKLGQRDSMKTLATGPMAKLQLTTTPVAAPGVAFTGPDGRPAHLSDFKGKVVVLNLWATWCAPCVKEMPTLAKLQTDYGPRGLQVVALSQDREQATAQAKAFLAKHPPLTFYQDAGFAVMPALGLPAPGFPTTVIYDKAGVQRAYLQGEADWSSPEAHAVLDKVLGE